MAVLYISALLVLISTCTLSLSSVHDEKIMLELLQSLGDTVPSNWNSVNFFCNWTGIKCDSSSRVTSISLPEISLAGTLPHSLMYLSKLKVLALPSNNLRGKLPSLANMMLLEDISLERNSFEEIPEDFVLGLTNLLRFSISHNPMLSPWNLPVQLKACRKLTTFYASNASLAGGIPDIFYTLPNLVNVSLSYNNLTGTFPESLTTLPHLENLDVSTNNLSGRIPMFPSTVNFKWNGNPLLGKNIASSGGSAKIQIPSGIIVAGVLVLMSVILAFTYIFYVDRQHPRLGSTTWASSLELNQIIRAFHIEELRKATLDFSQQVGRGGHGEVFKGTLNGVEIAVKRSNAIGRGTISD